MNQRIVDLEREIELTKELIELRKQLAEPFVLNPPTEFPRINPYPNPWSPSTTPIIGEPYPRPYIGDPIQPPFTITSGDISGNYISNTKIELNSITKANNSVTYTH